MIARPSDTWSSTAISSASRTGSRQGTTTTWVPRRTLVLAASQVRYCSGLGEIEYSEKWCSVIQIDSKPSSAASSSWVISSRMNWRSST